MKKRNIGICIITTTLLMGGPAKATELILAKDCLLYTSPSPRD